MEEVVTAIEAAGTNLLSGAGDVIAAALAIGVVFFGAKLLWRKFKGMAS